MSMTRDRQLLIFECECCRETFEDYADGGFQRIVDDMKAQGWRITREKGDWAHYCPKHAADPGPTAFFRLIE